MPWVGGTNITTSGSTFTFTSHAIGTADPYRRVVVAAYPNGGTVASISGVTIGGVSADIDVSLSTIITTGPMVIASRAVASGTAADIVVSTIGSASRCRIEVFEVVGNTGIPTFRTGDQTRSASATSLDRTLSNLFRGDEIIGAVGLQGSSVDAQNITWTNLTERSENNTGSSIRDMAVASAILGNHFTSRTFTGAISSAFEMGLLVAAYERPFDSLVFNPQPLQHILVR